jgi:hypothetical protein
MRSRPFKEKLDDLKAHPEDWQPTGAHVEKATRKGARNQGVSTQTAYKNAKTCETIYRRVVTDDAGKAAHDHFRDQYQPRKGDRREDA